MNHPEDKKQFRFKDDDNIFYYWKRLSAWWVIRPDGKHSHIANQDTMQEAWDAGELEEVK